MSSLSGTLVRDDSIRDRWEHVFEVIEQLESLSGTLYSLSLQTCYCDNILSKHSSSHIVVMG